MVIGDGMADNPVPELGGKTPIQVAEIPAIDALAADGVVGSVCNCPKPLPAGSETAILSIFGCDPLRYFTGRSPMEAAASGIELVEGDAAFRCNLVTLEDGEMPLEEKKILSHSAGSIEGDAALEAIGALLRDPEFAAALKKARMEIHTFPAFRQIAVQHQSDISGIEFTPPHDHLGQACGPFFPKGNDRAEVFADLMRLAHRILDHHPVTEKRRAAGKMPANGIWFWAQGTAVALPSFVEQYGCGGGQRLKNILAEIPLHGLLDSLDLRVYVRLAESILRQDQPQSRGGIPHDALRFLPVLRLGGKLVTGHNRPLLHVAAPGHENIRPLQADAF